MNIVKVRLSDEDLALLTRLTRSQPDVNVGVLCREIIGNYCADKRMAKRLAMSPAHYTMRGADDYTESE